MPLRSRPKSCDVDHQLQTSSSVRGAPRPWLLPIVYVMGISSTRQPDTSLRMSGWSLIESITLPCVDRMTSAIASYCSQPNSTP